MKARSAIHEAFVARFHFGELPTPVLDAELRVAEASLGTHLPDTYCEFLSRFGRVFTPLILDEITERGFEHPDFQEFLSPRDVVDSTKGYWAAGMPVDLIGFASDCMGNMFAFRRQAERCDDAPVFFFDHDFVNVSLVSPSFDEFLAWYLQHLTSTEPPS